MRPDDNDRVYQLSEMIQRIEPEKFMAHVHQYIRLAGHAPVPKSPPSEDKQLENPEFYFSEMEKETSLLLKQTEETLNCLTDFRFKIRRGKKLRKNKKNRSYFAKLRRQQRELLMGIAHDTEMIRDMIRDSEKMRDIFLSRRKLLELGDYLTDVIGERISQRAVPLPTISPHHADDRQGRQICDTFRDIRAYEEAGSEKLNDAFPEKQSPAKAFGIYDDLIRNTRETLRQREQNLMTQNRELKQGWTFLKKLVTKGYSSQMGKTLDDLLDRHRIRTEAFQRHVLKCRSEHFESLRSV